MVITVASLTIRFMNPPTSSLCDFPLTLGGQDARRTAGGTPALLFTSRAFTIRAFTIRTRTIVWTRSRWRDGGRALFLRDSIRDEFGPALHAVANGAVGIGHRYPGEEDAIRSLHLASWTHHRDHAVEGAGGKSPSFTEAFSPG